MAFFITLCLIILLICIGIGSKAAKTGKYMSYEKKHPPCTFQEEYLLACEYFHQYLFDGEPRTEAYANALRSARIDVYNNGYLPSNLEMVGNVNQ